ncbi:MAG TPA: type 4a pilus biogenesis protein PilO [Syntrophomonadaceae bacterium]|nr:type 4a pilus biogenesis protein PilO [Syntrophomonadaceae bacterium]
MKLTKREAILIYLLTVLLIIYLFYSLLYQPLLASIDKIVEENNEIQAISVLANKLNEGDYNNELDKKRAKLDKLNKQVPERLYKPEIIKFVEEMSRKHDLKILKAEYLDENEDKTDKEENLVYESLAKLDIQGEYKNLIKLVHELEKAERIYNIKKISMQVNQMEQITPDIIDESIFYNADNLLMSITFSNYYDELSP